jgi:hypothetical protein
VARYLKSCAGRTAPGIVDDLLDVSRRGGESWKVPLNMADSVMHCVECCARRERHGLPIDAGGTGLGRRRPRTSRSNNLI